MGKLELDEVSSNGETDLAPTTQCGTIGTETYSSVFSKVHRCVYVREKASLLKDLLIDDRRNDRLVGLSKVSLYHSIRHHPKRASTTPIIPQR